MTSPKKGKLVFKIYKYGNRTIEKKGFIRDIKYFIYKILDVIILEFFLNDEIPASTKIGDQLILYHPYGIIINKNSSIGDNVQIRHQVTIGNNGKDDRCPIIGDDVNIGAGAKIIGGIKIGNGCVIGANAVVTKSFPENSVLVGCPAKNIAK